MINEHAQYYLIFKIKTIKFSFIFTLLYYKLNEK